MKYIGKNDIFMIAHSSHHTCAMYNETVNSLTYNRYKENVHPNIFPHDEFL